MFRRLTFLLKRIKGRNAMLNFKYQHETELTASLHSLSHRQTGKEKKETPYFVSRAPGNWGGPRPSVNCLFRLGRKRCIQDAGRRDKGWGWTCAEISTLHRSKIQQTPALTALLSSEERKNACFHVPQPPVFIFLILLYQSLSLS